MWQAIKLGCAGRPRGDLMPRPHDDDTVITAGEWWAPDMTARPLISLRRRSRRDRARGLVTPLTINVLGARHHGTHRQHFKRSILVRMDSGLS